MAENNLPFDAMPRMLADIAQKLESIECKVNNLYTPQKEEGDIWLNLKDLCQYLPNHPAEQTVYGWTSTNFIPYHKKGKSIVFLKSEIDDWLRNGKKKSFMDIEREAKAFVQRNKSI